MRALILLALFGCKKSTTAELLPPLSDPGIEIVRGPLDQRDYGYLELNNGLRALVIHDPNTDMAAASLGVHVGHYRDPADREGLAHFLEHMLFMGTDEFPEVDAYGKYITDNGGWTNAGTGGEGTGYFFQVDAKHLEGALDRWSRFFVAPLLDKTYVDRERNAVNSEYSLKIKEHARRIREVRKATMNPDHPESQFSVGNLDTLGDRGTDTVHAALLDFYEKQYRPDQMTLAIIGKEPVSELTSWVRREFSEIPGKSEPRAERVAPFLAEHLGVRIDLAPLAERRHLEIQWLAESEEALWPQRPHSYVMGILGNEAEGTLFATLKKKGWIEALYAGELDGADDYDLLVAGYDLTAEGAQNIDAIVAATLHAVEKIGTEGLQQFRHDENTTMADLNFRFAEETPVVSAVNNATRSLSWAPPEHVLDWWAVPGTFDAPQIKRVTLSKLTVNNMRLVVTLPEHESGANLDQLEERYQVKYGMRPFTEAERSAFASDTGIRFSLPAPNPYLPADTALEPGGDVAGIPKPVDSSPVELWHQLDTTFGVPRAKTRVLVRSPLPRAQGLRSIATASLYSRLLNDSLQEFAYPLSEAGLRTSLYVNSDGMTIDVFGYDDRQGALLEDLASKIRGLKVEPERFVFARDGLARDWRNSTSRRPINQTSRALNETLNPNTASVLQLLPLLEELSIEEVQAMAHGFFAQAAAQVFVHGNLNEEQALSIAATVEGTLMRDSKPLKSFSVARRTIPDGKEVVRNLVIDHHDSTLMVRYQDTATDLDSQARWRMLGRLLRQPFFNKLRTEQQLGYVVVGGYVGADVLPGVNMRIQSTVAGPVTLLERVDTFLKDQHLALTEMSEEEFVGIRNGLATRLRESKTQLNQRSRELQQDLHLGQHTFDRKAVVADRVDTLNKADLIELWEQVFLGDSGRLIVRSFGTAHQDDDDGEGCNDEACAAKELGETYERELL